MSGPPVDASHRLRAALRRHGLLRRPLAVRRFLRRQGLRFTDGNRITLFSTGDTGLAAMLAAIAAATDRIHLETYILRHDATGRAFLTALVERAWRGVAVRLLYDALGSRTLAVEALEPLRAAGGQVVAFNPLHRFYPRWLPRRRDHRKLLIVDGRVAFTGGLNIGDEYNVGPHQPGATWRDTHLRIEGPAARDLEAVFLESWFRADGSDLPWGAVLAAPPRAIGTERVAVVADGPAYRRRVVRDLVALALASARQRVQLTSPYFAPDSVILTALARAAERGIQVSLLLAGRTDHPLLRRAARNLVPRLLDAGVTVYEYHHSMLHAKTTVVDGCWALAGTSNLDRQSLQHSYEVNVVIDAGAAPAELAALHEADLGLATRIDRTHLAARAWGERVLDRLCALLLWIV